MNKQEFSQLIRSTVNKVDSKAEVILFGSRARGEERKDSDWDILVLTDYPVEYQKEQAFREKLYDLELETGEPLSLFVFSKKDWFTRQRITPLFQNVSREGLSI
jgi:predicted nucleotidyltransferase